jgi:uncharacterized protein (DUF433 family)
MNHRVIEYDAAERTTYFPSLREALAAAKVMAGRRAVESLDRAGRWVCMETMIQGQYLTIRSDPAVLGGKPCFIGTRISVELIRDKLAAGESVADVARDYPQVPRAAIEALAWDHLFGQGKLVVNSAPPEQGDPDDVELTGDDFLH